jgi:hypothetical protein
MRTALFEGLKFCQRTAGFSGSLPGKKHPLLVFHTGRTAADTLLVVGDLAQSTSITIAKCG